MGIVSTVRGWFAREKSLESVLVAQLKRAGVSPRRGTSELLESFRTNPWVRAVVGRIGSEVAASTRWTLFDRPERDPRRTQIFDHPALDLLDDPNLRSGLSAQVVWACSQMSLDLVGDGFLVKDRDAGGKVVELSPVPVVDIGQTPTPTSPYFLVNQRYGSQRKIPVADMLWLKDPDPRDPYGRGVGTAEAAADEIDIDAEATTQIKSFFRNGMLPSHIVMLEGAGEAAVDSTEAGLKAMFQGSANRNRALITNKKFDVKALETSFKDMELVPLRKDQRDRFVSIYGVPPELFGILDSSNRATIDAARYLFAVSVLLPRLRLLRSELQTKLIVPEFGPGLFLGFESPVPDDRDFFIRAVATAPAAFRVNEVRARCGLMPDQQFGEERLTTAPIAAGPTNVPPGKGLNGDAAALAQMLTDLDHQIRALGKREKN